MRKPDDPIRKCKQVFFAQWRPATPSPAEQKGARELATLGGLGNAHPILILARRGKLADHPDETVRIMAQETVLELATAQRRAMQRHRYNLQLDDESLSSLEQTARFLKDQKIIPAEPDFRSCPTPVPGMVKFSSSMNGASPQSHHGPLQLAIVVSGAVAVIIIGKQKRDYDTDIDNDYKDMV